MQPCVYDDLKDKDDYEQQHMDKGQNFNNDDDDDIDLMAIDEDPWILPPEISILQYSLHSITILNGESLKNSNCFQGKLSTV